MEEFLSANGIDYVERDIAHDEKALQDLIELGIMTTPVTVIDDEIVVGFDQPRLEQLLED